ncbi:MAG: hypothetical protein BVN35_16675 [Proteobacteria bacterium ST_bin11]|nr:MAG: hypothetical protein BVN35_16675 [Proteobacteria bacterium ST_bin11]
MAGDATFRTHRITRFQCRLKLIRNQEDISTKSDLFPPLAKINFKYCTLTNAHCRGSTIANLSLSVGTLIYFREMESLNIPSEPNIGLNTYSAVPTFPVPSDESGEAAELVVDGYGRDFANNKAKNEFTTRRE